MGWADRSTPLLGGTIPRNPLNLTRVPGTGHAQRVVGIQVKECGLAIAGGSGFPIPFLWNAFMNTRFLRSYFLAMAAVLLPSCQSLPGGEEAVDVDAKVFSSDRGEGIQAVWLVEAGTGRKLEPLMDGVSKSLKIHFSPSKEWLAVDDRVMESFAAVRLFHHESGGGFRRIPEEEFILAAWRKFLTDEGLADGDVVGSAAEVAGWKSGGKILAVKLTATRRDGTAVSREHKVTLADHE